VNELANEYAGRLKVGALDVYRNPTMGKRYEVKGIPSVLFFRDGTWPGKWSVWYRRRLSRGMWSVRFRGTTTKLFVYGGNSGDAQHG